MTKDKMGSLPNLHELSKEKLDSPINRPPPITGVAPVKLPTQPQQTAHNHKRAKSTGHHHATALADNDNMLEVCWIFNSFFVFLSIFMYLIYVSKKYIHYLYLLIILVL